jgi:hypothetical protein
MLWDPLATQLSTLRKESFACISLSHKTLILFSELVPQGVELVVMITENEVA